LNYLKFIIKIIENRKSKIDIRKLKIEIIENLLNYFHFRKKVFPRNLSTLVLGTLWQCQHLSRRSYRPATQMGEQ